jgi:hypothetical protein
MVFLPQEMAEVIVLINIHSRRLATVISNILPGGGYQQSVDLMFITETHQTPPEKPIFDGISGGAGF